MDTINVIMDQLTAAITGGRSDQLLIAVLGLTCTGYIIYREGGRAWAFVYFATIPFLNWSFGVIEPVCLVSPASGDPGRVMFGTCAFESVSVLEKGVALHPLTVVTGLVFVFRDFVQRQMGQKVLIVMALGIAWAFYYAWPVIAIASGIAFAVSELADWSLYTFTKYRLSQRILLSSALAAPIDTTIFLIGADLAVQWQLGEPPGTMLHVANWAVFIFGKMIGAYFISREIRKREDAGLIDPASV